MGSRSEHGQVVKCSLPRLWGKRNSAGEVFQWAPYGSTGQSHLLAKRVSRGTNGCCVRGELAELNRAGIGESG
jgi:hypothetical protein